MQEDNSSLKKKMFNLRYEMHVSLPILLLSLNELKSGIYIVRTSTLDSSVNAETYFLWVG